MSDTPVKILAFAGSAKKASLNKKLLAVAVAGARAAGAEVTVVDLADYPMPIMDEDLEAAEGAPEKATAFKALMVEADGFLISCPEYNSSITPLLKNVIDWASRAAPDEKALVAYEGKTAALMACSPGPVGGLRGLPEVRRILSNIKVHVMPGDTAVGNGYALFGALLEFS